MPATHNFSDIFLSYSRRNLTFVRKLEKALRQHPSIQEIWVDWEDIPESADWRAEIKAGIEGADVFLFVITPESVVSVECGVEIEHAVEMKKRIVPVVHIEVTDPEIQEHIHPAIQRHNWFFMRDEDDFDEKLEALIKVLKTDQYHVNHHTRFLVRATEWINHDRENSYVLSGVEIDIGERWLREADEEGKEPAPTDAQREYITASRRIDDEAKAEVARREATIKRSRRATRLLMAFLALAFVAIVASVYLINNARTEIASANEDIARADVQIEEANEQIVQAREQIATADYQIAEAAIQSTDAANTLREVTDDSYDYRMIGQALLNQVDENEALAFAYEAIGNSSPPTEILPVFYEIASRSRNRSTIFSYPSGASQVAFSSDGLLLASIGCRIRSESGIACVETGLHLWSINTGEMLWHFEGESNQVAVTFSPQNNVLVSADESGVIDIWDATTGDLLSTAGGHTGAIIDLSFNADGTMLASSSFDGTIRLWRVMDGRLTLLVEIEDVPDSTGVAFSPDNSSLAVAFLDGTIQIRDAVIGELLTTLSGHNSHVNSVEFSPDGTRLVSASFDGTLRLWNVESGASFALRGHSDWVSDAVFSPDGEIIASASFDNTVRLWNGQTGEPVVVLRGHEHWVMGLIFSPDGETLASASFDGTVKLWDTLEGAERRTLSGHTGDVSSVDFHPGSDILASGSFDNTVRIWDIHSGQQLASFEDHNDRIMQVAISPVNNLIASAGVDNRIYLRNLVTGQQLLAITEPGHSDDVLDIVFSPDGETLASAGADSIFRLWDIDTGSARTVNNPGGAVTAIAFSPDGTTIATGSADYVLRLWDVSTNPKSLNLVGHSGVIHAVAFSPDGALVASAGQDGTIRLWDIAEQVEAIPALRGHLEGVNSLAFSIDGTTIASAGQDGTIRLWDVTNGILLLTVETGEGSVNQVTFSQDGETLASAHASGVIKLWNIGSLSFMRQWVQENRYVREFSCAQRNDYDVRVNCAEDGTYPTRTPYPTVSPVVNAPLEYVWTPEAVIQDSGTETIVSPFWIPTLTPTLTPTPTATATVESTEEVEQTDQADN